MLPGPESRYCWAQDAAVDSYGYPRLNYMDIQYVSQALSGFSDFMDFRGNCSWLEVHQAVLVCPRSKCAVCHQSPGRSKSRKGFGKFCGLQIQWVCRFSVESELIWMNLVRHINNKYMGAARFPGPPHLHDLHIWFKQLILQLPICIRIVQHVTWEIGCLLSLKQFRGLDQHPTDPSLCTKFFKG